VATARLEARHRPSGINSRFAGERLPFSDYAARCRGMLASIHACATDAGKIIEGNAPFEMDPLPGFAAGQTRPYRRGVLLTHGLSDSPYMMRHLAESFRQRGFRVMALLLPGHGTQPGDLLDVAWQDWAKTVAYGAYQLAKEADEIYLAGYSAGAALSLYQCLRDDRVRGLFLFSPALGITRKAAFANWHKLYSWLLPAAGWVDIKPDLDIYKYESFTKNAAAQTHALIKAVNRQLRDRVPDLPLFMAASADDATVRTSATFDFLARSRHPLSKLVLYSTEPEKIPTHLPEEKVELVNSAIPEQRILSSAHTAILMPPWDSHYGRVGDYANCVHYYPDEMEKYAACLGHSDRDFQGEITEQNLKAGLLRRLTYNPHFDALMISMQRFIELLP
jgi:esterase/lipase